MSHSTAADSFPFLPVEYKSYLKQYVMPKPDGYIDMWHATLGECHPVRDEYLLLEGRMPGLDVARWRRDHPKEEFPIHPGIDRGFPARWGDVRKEPRGIQIYS